MQEHGERVVAVLMLLARLWLAHRCHIQQVGWLLAQPPKRQLTQGDGEEGKGLNSDCGKHGCTARGADRGRLDKSQSCA
jgi:hypothetical protein